jgi:hypothetical protein
MYAGEAVVLAPLGILLRPCRRLGGAGDRLRRWDTDCAIGRDLAALLNLEPTGGLEPPAFSLGPDGNIRRDA